MDLRPYITSKKQLDRAQTLIRRGQMRYQPFIYADDLQVGVGYEFLGGKEFAGMVYWPTLDPKLVSENPHLKRSLVDNSLRDEFIEANRCLRVMYDGFVEQICSRVGDVAKLTFADVGCNSGYFPISFAKRGAKKAVGFDRSDYSKSFALLNELLGTHAKFINRSYEGRLQRIPGCRTYDVVSSIAVLCHLSDPLQHLAFLGSISRKALFVWAPVTDDEDFCIRFGQPNRYYKEDQFPLCFDNQTRPSRNLFRKSFELMGFTEIHELPNTDGGMPDHFYRHHVALLGLR